MESNRFDDAVRALVSTPSRRALNRALAGLFTGALLAPLLRDGDAAAKKGHGKGKAHRHKEKRRNKRKKPVSEQCVKGYAFCAAGQGQSSAGDYSGCCKTSPDPQYDPPEVCTDCGCCPFDYSQCCPSAGDGLCCPNGYQCSYSVDFKYSACCAPDDKTCFGACCEAIDECCTTTENVPYCCSGEENLTCKKSGGPTCVKKT